MRLSRVAVALSLALTAAVAALATPAPKAVIGEFGLDLAGRDASVKPGDDFNRYASGRWLAADQVPSDRARWNAFDRLRERATEDVRQILEAAAASDAATGSNQRKIGDFYSTFLDSAAIDANGLKPAAVGLEAIAKAGSYEELARLLSRADLSLPSPIDANVTLDPKNPDAYVVVIGHGGIGLPDRDYYLREDGTFPGVRDHYRAHIERLLTLAGDPDAAIAATHILALETEIAKLHWPRADRRDRDKTYNPATRAELTALAPEFPWNEYFAAADLAGVEHVLVLEKNAIGPLAQLFRATPVQDWRRYLRYHYLRVHAAELPTAYDREVFEFFGHELNGQPEQRARWKRAVTATNDALGEAVGQIYVTQHFPPAAKAQMQALVGEMRAAYARHIAALDWMSPATKAVAAEKLERFRPKIGYPDHWRDYSALEVRRGDAFGNVVRSNEFEWHRQVARLGKPTDRDEWFMTPQTVNAYYNPIFNEIVFPAAILQAPFFDPAADPAVNYGAIGGVIGHEMGHGFDDQGAKSDARGVLRTWWDARDVAAFHTRTDRLADQYGQYEPLPGIRINGRLTLGENIGDLGGLSVAFDAYHTSLKGRRAPTLAGLSGDQRFFLAWAQIYRAQYRDENLRNQVLSDPHSPDMYRINGVVRNVDGWYRAFNVQPRDKLYLAPAERVRIW
jgi:predicted metalloendopeptidase